MHRYGMFLLLALAACKDDDKNGETGNIDDTGDTADTSETGDTGDTADTNVEVPCETVAIETEPEDEEDAWFYRDPMTVKFSDDASEAVLQLFGPDGAEIPTTATWADGNFQVEIAPTTALLGSTTYTLHIEVCEYTGDVTFTTSVYGSALEESADALVGNTYVLDLSRSEILQPEGLGVLLASYLTEPLLIGVDHADESVIGLVGAQGYKKSDGSYKQVGDQVWIFPDADFTTNPYFSASTESIGIDYSGATITIESFELSGTFAPDGSAIGGGHAQGWGDTREMGPLLELGDDPGAVCEFIAMLGLGVECSECADGEPYCLFIEARFDEAPIAEGLTIDTSVGE